MEPLKEQLSELKSRLGKIKGVLNLDEKARELRELEAQSVRLNFWDDQERARRMMQKIGALKSEIEKVEKTEKELEDTISVTGESGLELEIEQSVRRLTKQIDSLETLIYLSGVFDKSEAILSIHSGQGGTEAMDWANMLFRMYLRFAERREWNIEIVDKEPGEEAGIKSATILVSGQYAYGYLKGEAGTHRLVRQSPFNANSLRQTSFALVEVLPQMEDSPDIEIKDEDLDIQFYRSGGHGGQNVNKVSTAVRLTHIPTGLVVTAQTERFQEQNRKIALNLLRAKLWLRQQAEAEAQAKSIKGEYRPAAWGTQIRSYVLHPYKMIKDLRTQAETGNTEAVLDGDLDQFIEAELVHFANK